MQQQQPASRAKSVLIVDDDETFGRVLARNFERAGYVARAVTSLALLKAELESFHADYAVLDLHLDGESGLDALDLVRQSLPDCTAVILSGYIDVCNAASAVRAGAVDCLVKPIGFDEIRYALENAVRHDGVCLPEVRRPCDVRLHHIVSRWEKNNRNTTKTARDLGMHRRSLQRNLESAGIVRDDGESGGTTSRFGKLRRLYRVWSQGFTAL